MTSAIHFEVEYRLKRWLLLRSQYSRYSGKLISGSSQGSTDEITFDVKLRWEY
jgi:hypothetical protein